MTLSRISSGKKNTKTGIVCLYACVINHQKPTTTQPLPGATRTHPHVADGNRVPSVFSLKAEQMPTVSDRFQGADF